MSSHIPFDICVQIIERLPVKTLIRFRSVCKAWKSFMDCSEFIAAYSFHHSQSQHLMIEETVGYGEEKEVKYISFVDDDTFPQQNFALTVPSLDQGTTIRFLVGSSHGLLCLSGYFREQHGSSPTSRTQMAVLWNPTIRKSIAVIVPHVVHPLFNFVLGFGVCPYTKDPKIVKISYINDQRKMGTISCIPCQVMVFTLSTGEWTTSCSNLPRKSIEFENGSQEVIGQFIYLYALDRTDENDQCHSLMMSFDLSTDEFREIDLPDRLRVSYLSISRLWESLVLLDYRETTYKQVCDVWMMDHGDPKTFTKLFTINPPNATFLSTLGFRKSGEPIIDEFGSPCSKDDDDDDDDDTDDDEDFESSCALDAYESCLEQIKVIWIWGNKHSSSMTSYTESLLLLDHDNAPL